jgi:hypothetical protein
MHRVHEGQAADGIVRLLSCGHDGQLALWDFDVSPEALTPVRYCSSQHLPDFAAHVKMGSSSMSHCSTAGTDAKHLHFS